MPQDVFGDKDDQLQNQKKAQHSKRKKKKIHSQKNKRNILVHKLSSIVEVEEFFEVELHVVGKEEELERGW